MLRQRLVSFACCVLLGGCATVYSFPKPMGGVRTHAEVLGITRSPGNYLSGLGTVVWLVALPVSLPDLALSLAADLGLLPILGPPAWVEAIRTWRRAAWAEEQREREREDWLERQPPPPTPEQMAMTERRKAVVRAETARAAAAKVALTRLTTDAWQAAAGDPDEQQRVREVMDQMLGVTQMILRQEDTFIWLPEAGPIGAESERQLGGLLDGAEARGAHPTGWIMAAHLAERCRDGAGAIELCNAALARDPLQAPAWTVRGWARLQLGDLERAELDLGLGEVLALDRLNRAWATIGLGRVAEARGRRAQARLQYERVLGDPHLVRSLQVGVDHVSDLRRRLVALARD